MDPTQSKQRLTKIYSSLEEANKTLYERTEEINKKLHECAEEINKELAFNPIEQWLVKISSSLEEINKVSDETVQQFNFVNAQPPSEKKNMFLEAFNESEIAVEYFKKHKERQITMLKKIQELDNQKRNFIQ